MRPRARRYGWRYYIDSDFRFRMRKKELAAHYRKRYGTTFIYQKRRIKLALIARDGRICQICKHFFPLQFLTIDHIVPVRDGGKSNMENLQLLCEPCHQEKDNPRQPFRNPVITESSLYELQEEGKRG